MSRRASNAAQQSPYLAAQFAMLIVNELLEQHDEEVLTPSTVNRIICRRELGPVQRSHSELLGLLNTVDRYPAQTKLVQQNCLNLCGLFGVPDTMAKVIEFVLVHNANTGLHHLVQATELTLLEQDFTDLIAQQAGLSRAEVLEYLMVLVAQGLFLEGYDCGEIHTMGIPRPMLQTLMREEVDSKEMLLHTMLHPSPEPKFKLKHFPHVNTDLLSQYLHQACAEQHEGVSILLYGDAGNGKTELARTLADYSGRILFEVRNLKMDEGKPSNEFSAKNASGQRLEHLALLQRLLAGSSDAILLIDECESLFRQADGGYSKETLHRMIEQSEVPCIWITNHVYELENSYIRRFKLCEEVRQPDKKTLLSIAKQSFKGLSVSEKYAKSLVNTPSLTPAILQNAGYIASTMALASNEAQQVIGDVVEGTLRACMLWKDGLTYKQQMAFDPTLLNLKQGPEVLNEIAYAVEHQQPIRVLLCGPPGTGKTAFAHYLAEQNDHDLFRVKCSDILSKYVGDSEKQVARLFETAHHEQKILLLDEVDSLLTSRERLKSHHELTLVNELLAQMECFTQPLFAATNYETLLDKAVLRRFDFKLDCDYLTAPQVIALYKRSLSVKTLADEELSVLAQLKLLTPGDFAILARRMMFQPKQNHRSSALELLKGENNRKQPNRTIGFVH